jgi:hypothetical protein
VTLPYQPSLLDYRPPVAAPTASEQGRNLARVGKGLAPAILAWCAANVGRVFRLSEMTAEVGGDRAPDSVRRILRELRAQGHVSVTLLSRAGSLYRLDDVRAP